MKGILYAIMWMLMVVFVLYSYSCIYHLEIVNIIEEFKNSHGALRILFSTFVLMGGLFGYGIYFEENNK